ncbi:protein kinase domain-containing protein [Bdellovibrio sp. HCB2-146]|uniref:protein kinase domain-containing protein n=1 Tax=Bdellovibrio sp. HCB2-146 TaxID=3394362 RepID=UPI0039BC72C2
MSQSSVEHFGKYILLERLAAGGMAEVYLSKSTGAVGVNKFVAIKRILPQFSDNPEFIDMFKEEAKIAVNLNHGNVVSIYDFGVEKGQFFLVMEYVEGRNLRQILNELKKANTQFTIEQISYMMKEVAAGLDHAHRLLDGTTGKPLNIVHRDMSPQNIMVSFEGEVKIIDFGIAKAETQIEATKAGTLKGKYGYMSPEQADGQNIDPRTDIFSLGIVLWELLANDRLFTSNSEAAILRKIRDCQIPAIRKINPSVPPELERIVNKALAKDRSLRYQTAAALHRDLNRFLNTQYPEFSPHDFSVFMKNAFAAVYLEQKRKLVEFAKIQALGQNNSTDDKTVVTQTDVRGGSTQKTMIYTPPSASGEANDGEENLQLDTSTDIRVNLDSLKDPNRPKMSRIRTESVITHTQGHTKTAPGNTRTPNPMHRVAMGPSVLERVASFAMRSVILMLVGVGAWWAYENYMPTSQGPSRRPTSPNVGLAPTTAPTAPEQAPPQDTVDMAATAPSYAVTIYSQPDKARVYIDGQDTGENTPYRTTLKANTPASVRLVLEGYEQFTGTVTPTYEAYTFTGSLSRLKSTGYLFIRIVNGGANPELRIGGTPVQIKRDSEYYPIQAGVPVTIQVVNKTTGLRAEATVNISANQKKNIELLLK